MQIISVEMLKIIDERETQKKKQKKTEQGGRKLQRKCER